MPSHSATTRLQRSSTTREGRHGIGWPSPPSSTSPTVSRNPSVPGLLHSRPSALVLSNLAASQAGRSETGGAGRNPWIHMVRELPPLERLEFGVLAFVEASELISYDDRPRTPQVESRVFLLVHDDGCVIESCLLCPRTSASWSTRPGSRKLPN